MMVSALLEREQESALPIRNGAFVAIVGPSGAGKDTLIAHARDALADEPQVEFVRRVITRPCDGETEDHDTLADAEFLEALAEGAFALAWEAHGLRYGLPASVDRAIENGHVAVANVSRGALPTLRQRYVNVAIVEVTADPEILAARLAGRGRESRGEILARLARTVACDTIGPNAIALDNSGPKDIAGDKLVAIIRKAMAFADMSGAV
jgi:ribose 1,5-bisphosphokinase